MNRTRFVFITALALALPWSAHAHRAWILPAATVLSSDDPWVTVDAAVSNDIFHTDYRPLSIDGITITAPDGSTVAPQNVAQGKYRSTFDVQLAQRGTYKIFTAGTGLSASWEEKGERRFYPPRGQRYTEEGFAKAVPKRAKNLNVVQFSRRMETFVTAGEPDTGALAPTGVGLELVPDTHPNDLFAGESARFQLLIDGEPAVGAKVTVIPGGMRYRNDQAAIEAVSDDSGHFSITWPHAGQYWLEAGYSDDRAKAPAKQRRGSYVATFEVLPQ